MAKSVGGKVVAVCLSEKHSFSKASKDSITLVEGIGVDGDAHAGQTVKHRSRVKRDPNQPNLRQVHLIHSELFDELRKCGFEVSPGNLGENITTKGIDLLALPQKTRLHIGPSAIVEVTGLRNPCLQLDSFIPGLMKAVLVKDEKGNLKRKSGIMSVVIKGGQINLNDAIEVVLPPSPYIQLEVV